MSDSREIPRNPIISLKPYLNKNLRIDLIHDYSLEGKLISFSKYNNIILDQTRLIDESNKLENLGKVHVKGSNVS